MDKITSLVYPWWFILIRVNKALFTCPQENHNTVCVYVPMYLCIKRRILEQFHKYYLQNNLLIIVDMYDY